MVLMALSALGNMVGKFFGWKRDQAGVMQTALQVLGDTNASNAQRESAIAMIISSEATSGYWLAAVWRPLLMVTFAGMIISYWFGYVPPNLNAPMSPMMAELFGILKLGIGGYIGGRTLEKIIGSLNIGGVLKKFIEKKLA